MMQRKVHILLILLIMCITLPGCAFKAEKKNLKEDNNISEDNGTSESNPYVKETQIDEDAKETDVTMEDDYTGLVSDEKISQMTQKDIETLSDEELIGLGQRMEQGNFEKQGRKHEFAQADSSDVCISSSSAADYASAEEIAKTYFTPSNDSYWYHGFELSEETEAYWLFKSYYNNQNVVDEPDYLLVFASSYFDYEASKAGFELNEENIKEFVAIYGVSKGGFCLAEFVNEEEESYQYINYNLYISGGDYGLCDTVYLEKYVFVFQKEGHELKRERQDLKMAEIPGTMNDSDEEG